MTNLRNSWKLALSAVVLLVAAQVVVSLSVRTHRVHNYLSARLENAFGRPVQVKRFNLEILPSPRIYATGVTIGEDPAFGYEYFLRAEHLTAGLRWWGFLRGHFEFGTLSLSQPSLTLVRNREGRWNLEDWLPPAKKATGSGVYGPGRAPAVANRLEKIYFEDGRIDFKSGDVKQPFALTAVGGRVEQISPGRWQLQLGAQPWRTGVALQSTGTIQVHGDVAGTSARLQPASFTVRWDKVSLADLFRLLRGRDYGVRGTFALEATAKSGLPLGAADPAALNDSFPIGVWSVSLKASATQIHRWDLPERTDNPGATTNIRGSWNVALGNFTVDTLSVETAASNLRGNAQFGIATNPFMKVNFESAGIQAVDLLSWYRAFHSDVAEGIAADEYFSGSLALHGFPFTLDALDFSTLGGTVSVRGLHETIRIGTVHAVLDRTRLAIDPAHFSFLSATSRPLASAGTIKPVRHRSPNESGGEANLTLLHDFAAKTGVLSIQGRIDKVESALRIATAFGHSLNHGWDLTGPARVELRREWSPASRGAWNGSVEVNDAQLAAAGLNQPVQLQQARLDWRHGKRAAQVGHAEGFGATWSGDIVEDNSAGPEEESAWIVQLHADRLDAAELDRWVGPRARPSWLQRLLPSLLGGAADSGPASELVRRLNVSGDLLVDEFTIEKLRLQQMRLHGSLHDLQLEISDGRAQWAGGTVRASMLARFLPRPVYEVRAELDGVNLSQLPIDPTVADRLGGVASATLHLKTAGVGREELLQKMTAAGKVRLADLEFRGWDVNASVVDGEAHPGVSRWALGDGAFTLRDRNIFLEHVRLDGAAQTTLVDGSVTFGRDANLAVETSTGRPAVRNTAAPVHVLKIVGPLDEPRLSRENSAPRQPAD